jgi:hypothetical protein
MGFSPTSLLAPAQAAKLLAPPYSAEELEYKPMNNNAKSKRFPIAAR